MPQRTVLTVPRNRNRIPVGVRIARPRYYTCPIAVCRGDYQSPVDYLWSEIEPRALTKRPYASVVDLIIDHRANTMAAATKLTPTINTHKGRDCT
ncbi:hypothetical protein [Acetanaerobacterium elongatum]|uniref:hypothetical protein n=1 Tax=Acetanaerobacterium elongatum TaxID=258515 RepID=UPI00115FB256|nr:hypothetical protein [Acetanaerobacterium elongatum]